MTLVNARDAVVLDVFSKFGTVVVAAFARYCSTCGAGMNKGFCFGDGESYGCERCTHKEHSDEELTKMYEEGASYYTEWEVCEDDIVDPYDTPVGELMDAILHGTPINGETCKRIKGTILTWFRESGHSRVPSDYADKLFKELFPKPWSSERVRLIHAYHRDVVEIAKQVMEEDN